MTTSRTAVVLAALTGAVVLGAAGQSVAGSMITGKQVKNGSLTTKDVKDGSLQGADLSAATLQQLTGKPGAAGAAGAPGISGLQRVSMSLDVSGGSGGSVAAECPAGKKLISGGGGATFREMVIYYSAPANDTTYLVQASVFSGTDAPAGSKLFATAICATVS